MWRLIPVLAGALIVAGGCRREDVRTAVVYVPGVKSAECLEYIYKALATEQGIAPESVDVDLKAKILKIRYDSVKLSSKNVEFTIAEAGFAANEIPADAEAQARLPAGCR